MFRFAHPWFLLLLLPLIAAAWAIYGRRISTGTLYPGAGAIPNRMTWKMLLYRILPLFVLIGTAFCIVGLARPQNVFSEKTRTTKAIAIQMVLDTSGSMGGLDFSQGGNERTRLDVVKETFESFVNRREQDLIGLVTFAGYATSRVPLTLDHDVFSHALDAVQLPRQRIRGRRIVNEEEFMTAIGDGLATACARLENAEVTSKVVVLLSDGESNAGIITPEQATEAAKTLNIKVYTIGVGSTGNVKVKSYVAGGRAHFGYQKFRLDEAMLTQIAETTGGRYYNVRSPDALQKALQEIDQLEKTEIDQTIYSQQDELFLPWVVTGTGLLLIGFLGQVVSCGRLI